MKHKIETLVIGGGAIGICCAHYLQEQGREVMVVEKGDICSGASHGNAGLIVPSYSMPLAAPGVISKCLGWLADPESPFYIKPSLRPTLFHWLWKFRGACTMQHVHRSIPVLRDMTTESLRLFTGLAAGENMDFGYEKRGLLELFRTPAGFEQGKNTFKLLQSYGIKADVLGNADLAQLIGGLKTYAVGAIFSHGDAFLIPDKFVKQMAEYAAGRGVRLATQVEVIGFKKAGRRVTRVHTTRGDISVKEVVLAGGAWSSQIARDLNIRLMIEPAKGYSITFRKPHHCPEIPCTLAEAYVVLTPMRDTVRFAGTLELAGFDQSINLQRVKAVLKTVPRYFPDLDPNTMEVEEIWQGLRPCTPDGLPSIGRPHSCDNVMVAAGHGVLGISLAPATGKLVSQLLTDETPFMDPRPLRIERFS
ncbi:MAG: FAD-dependent oxidoreductase [Deltaproteobacteria bacterium]|nr:MAG: FAD-dependent oxidoreductase [Deltaproteobacteria bacterium]